MKAFKLFFHNDFSESSCVINKTMYADLKLGYQMFLQSNCYAEQVFYKTLGLISYLQMQNLARLSMVKDKLNTEENLSKEFYGACRSVETEKRIFTITECFCSTIKHKLKCNKCCSDVFESLPTDDEILVIEQTLDSASFDKFFEEYISATKLAKDKSCYYKSENINVELLRSQVYRHSIKTRFLELITYEYLRKTNAIQAQSFLKKYFESIGMPYFYSSISHFIKMGLDSKNYRFSNILFSYQSEYDGIKGKTYNDNNKTSILLLYELLFGRNTFYSQDSYQSMRGIIYILTEVIPLFYRTNVVVDKVNRIFLYSKHTIFLAHLIDGLFLEIKKTLPPKDLAIFRDVLFKIVYLVNQDNIRFNKSSKDTIYRCVYHSAVINIYSDLLDNCSLVNT